MTDSPVAAANARTMWKREIPPIAEISSRVNSPARWLSIYQSAFWAGFMDHGLHSKRTHHHRFARASFDSPCSRSPLRNRNRTHVIFHSTENSSEAVVGNVPQSCLLRSHPLQGRELGVVRADHERRKEQLSFRPSPLVGEGGENERSEFEPGGVLEQVDEDPSPALTSFTLSHN